MIKWKYNIIEGYDRILMPDFIEKWQQLVDHAEHSHVFFTPSLVRAWLDTYIPLRHLQPFVIVAELGENIALMPMVIWRKNWKNAFIRTIVPIGYSDFDYHDPIFKLTTTDDEISAFWSGLIDLLKSRYDYDNISIEGITDSIASDVIDWRKDEICPLLNLGDMHSNDDLMAFFKTSLRGDIRRQIRRLEEIGKLKFREFSSWADIPQSTFSEFIRQHTMRWPNAYKAPHFHENLLKYGLKSGVVHFSTLSVGETEIAWHLGFSYRGRYYYYMPAGNQDYFKFSPTKIHLYILVRRAVENDYTVYDHLRGEENYKSGWSNSCQYVNSFGIKGIGLVTDVKYNILRMRELPPPIRSVSDLLHRYRK